MLIAYQQRFYKYYKLVRLDQPTGVWLLLLPCLWGVAISSDRLPTGKLLLVFVLGSVLMRSAGCVINDLVDVDLDSQVARTRNRPLTSGAVSKREAYWLVTLLVSLSAMLLCFTNLLTVGLAAFSLIPVVIYPFMKRLTNWPQAVLGLTFNFGVLMAYAATRGHLGLSAFFLYIAGFFWTLSYDTIYAHQDKKDDALIGIKSTALTLGKHTKVALIIFGIMLLFCLVGAGRLENLNNYYYWCLLPVSLHLSWQIKSLNIDNVDDCMAKFRSSRLVGALILLAIIVGKYDFSTYY